MFIFSGKAEIIYNLTIYYVRFIYDWVYLLFLCCSPEGGVFTSVHAIHLLKVMHDIVLAIHLHCDM